MLFYHLGSANWHDAQAIVCALAKLGRPSAVLSRESSPCLCAGGRVDLDQTVDTGFCGARGIPLYRRESRHGALCFSQRQLELQIVVPLGHPLLKRPDTAKSRPALIPLRETCRALKLEAAYRAPSQIVVRGRRIGKGCAGPVHQCTVLAASLVLEFDADLFAQVLNAPDPSLRAWIAESARARRTSLLEELGALPPMQTLEECVCEQLRAVVGDLEPAAVDDELRAQMESGAEALFAASRVHAREATGGGWHIDLGAGAELRRCTYKAPGGFLRATCEWRDGKIARAALGGDFFCYPPGTLYRLEEALVGTRADQVTGKITQAYGRLGLVTPGIHAAHWARVLEVKA